MLKKCKDNNKGGDYSALQGGEWSALQGGDWSALQGGEWSVIYGGEKSKVKGGKHSVLAIQYWQNNEFKCIKFAEVDGANIKENTFYRLNENGEFIEADEDE